MVYVCSVLPTIDDKNNERREKANEMIRATCEEKDATVVNNDLNFTYRDGSCDKAAFVTNGIHLSAHGLTKLLSNISLSGALRPTNINWLPVLSNIEPPPIRRDRATLQEYKKAQQLTNRVHIKDILRDPPKSRLRSRRLFVAEAARHASLNQT